MEGEERPFEFPNASPLWWVGDTAWALHHLGIKPGLNYMRVAIDLEPAQRSQLFCTMIATAFVTDDIEEILDAGVAALDPRSVIREIVAEVRAWDKE